MALFERKPKKFQTGRLIVTDEITDMMENEDFKTFVYASYIRYCANDWGDLEKSDKKLNRQNLKHGGNLGGRYIDEENNWEIWILTSDSRDRTIITLPNKTIDDQRAEVEHTAGDGSGNS